MPYRKSFLLIGMALIACQAQTTELPPSAIPATLSPLPSSTPPFAHNLVLLAEEFQALRGIPGQFSGGEWVDEVDQWQGRKHQVMLALAEQVSREEFNRSQLTTLLGPADHIVTGGDALFEQIQNLPGDESVALSNEFLVYEWRGIHDFLFFAIQDDRILASGWWYAGE